MRNLLPSDRVQAAAPNPFELSDRLGAHAISGRLSESGAAALHAPPGPWEARKMRWVAPSTQIALVSPAASDATCELLGFPSAEAVESA